MFSNPDFHIAKISEKKAAAINFNWGQPQSVFDKYLTPILDLFEIVIYAPLDYNLTYKFSGCIK
jgi:hypothetical protein